MKMSFSMYVTWDVPNLLAHRSVSVKLNIIWFPPPPMPVPRGVQSSTFKQLTNLEMKLTRAAGLTEARSPGGIHVLGVFAAYRLPFNGG